MNTQSTDLHPELTETLAHAQQMLAVRQRVEEEREQQARAARAAKIAESWANPLARLYDDLPEWIHQYITQPDAIYEAHRFDADHGWYEYTPAVIAVPGCNDIAAWVDRTGPVHYEIFQPKLYQDDDGIWSVRQTLWQARRISHNLDSGETDIAVTLLRAREVYLQCLDLQHMAVERNSVEIDPDVLLVAAPDPTPAPDPIDQALTLIGKLERSEQIKSGDATGDPEDFADERTLVLAAAGLAIAHHLRRTADALERLHWSK